MQERRCTRCGASLAGAQIVGGEELHRSMPSYALECIDRMQRFALGAVTNIGRTQDLAAYLEDKLYVSRRHAAIIVEAGEVYIEDRGSSNGTYIDNQRIPSWQRRRVRINEEIGLGGCLIEGSRQPEAAYFVLRQQ